MYFNVLKYDKYEKYNHIHFVVIAKVGEIFMSLKLFFEAILKFILGVV